MPEAVPRQFDSGNRQRHPGKRPDESALFESSGIGSFSAPFLYQGKVKKRAFMPGTVRLLAQLQHMAPIGESLNMASDCQECRGIISAYGSLERRAGFRQRTTLRTGGWIP